MISDFAKEKVFWTRKMNLKLVKYIQSKPNIWNPKHPKYTSVEYRDKTYAEFAEKYGNEFTGQAVKDRWTNIRSTFANYVRKITASRVKGDGEEYKVNWPLWEPCQFLMKVNRRAKADTSTSIAEEIEDVVDETKDNSQLSTKEDEWSSDDNDAVSDTSATNTNCTAIANNLITVFKGVQNDAFGLDNSRNAKIGRAVNRKLSQMNSYDAATMSHKIMEILLLYDANNPLNPNTLKSDYM
ncbi:uncharacterized protein LOC134670561 [Cydia fagiglandana]|uniref:uncharacterized protein LOC134670561 n=1 Tax=Cydia fagiglandana TaxID=1458189 RepID=UPI002FEDF8D6